MDEIGGSQDIARADNQERDQRRLSRVHNSKRSRITSIYSEHPSIAIGRLMKICRPCNNYLPWQIHMMYLVCSDTRHRDTAPSKGFRVQHLMLQRESFADIGAGLIRALHGQCMYFIQSFHSDLTERQAVVDP